MRGDTSDIGESDICDTPEPAHKDAKRGWKYNVSAQDKKDLLLVAITKGKVEGNDLELYAHFTLPEVVENPETS